ncbi:DNA recombination protein RmuC [Aquirufa regiilacus]|uniref:DNA recombination protein RmuC n=1 Tax=Aquirufa regiilacus TaxID=3024868 RepID=A0ABU3TUL6_9BACT|nr:MULTISPECIES: DNA recombination protein RmuC [unclassified Aquirufa]MDT8888258.1 DNA recombination protein RmuC [Aquirufa sp. LEPPI-3A]MDU0809552.1 DNA recombination protein RmuC [Aquirufa sp. LEOWEIH-7C]
MTIIYIIIAILVGAGASYLLLQNKITLLNSQLSQLTGLQTKADALEQDNKTMFGKLSQLEGQNETLKATVESQKADEDKLRKMLTDISNESVLRQGRMLSDQQQVKLNDVLTPLKEKLLAFETQVNEGQKNSLHQNTVLLEQIKNLTSLNQTVTQKTEDLTNALKGSNKSQGNWGEMILERVLESSGLKKGMEYETQFVTKNQINETIKPDAVIFLPDNKNLIIDSKVSLTAYERYTSAEEGTIEKEQALKEHIESLKSHIKLLSAKDYHTGLDLNSPDFTLLFIPIESGFVATISQDTTLFNYAWERKIVLVSPSTLLATLRTIASVWKTEYQTRNAIEIARQAGDLYDKFVSFTQDMEDVGKHMKRAEDAHAGALNKLSTGKGNLVSRAEKLHKLGIKSTKKLNQGLIQDEEPEIEEE